MAQLNFARAYDSIYGAPRGAQTSDRGAFEGVAQRKSGVYTPGLGNGGQYTAGWPPAGLQRQSHALPSVHGSIFASVQEAWAARGCRLEIGKDRLTHICWAEDTLLIAKSAARLDWVIGTLDQAAREIAGLDQRRGEDAPALPPTEECDNLRRMAELPA